MEQYTLQSDLPVFYITATSFPDGIMAAHEKVHSLVPFSKERKYLGISRPEPPSGEIIYRAAVSEKYPGEGFESGCAVMVVPGGKYISIFIKDYRDDVSSISRAFDEILDQPGLDPDGYCIECYENEKDVRCMVRLDPGKE